MSGRRSASPAAARRGAAGDLQEIPGVGPSLARDLLDLGYRRVSDLERADPEMMYARLMALREAHIDRCVLYVFRAAVYYARTPGDERDPELLKWWRWKDACHPGVADPGYRS